MIYYWKRFAVVVLGLLISIQLGCRHSDKAAKGSLAGLPSMEYVQLQSGWRVRVVIPILSSGGYILQSAKTRTTGNTIEVEAGDEFIGYERDEYAISSREGGGVRLRFHSAETWRDGKVKLRPESSLPLFRDAEKAKYIRLVYLTRESEADHDMAIVASNDERALDEITRTVVRDGQCKQSEHAACTFVPKGVAVTPEGRGAPHQPIRGKGGRD